MKCQHCGYEAPERAVICPECGEILPRPKKPAAEEQAKKEPSPAAEKFSMPFLSAPADLEKADGIAAEDPEELRRAAQEKKFLCHEVNGRYWKITMNQLYQKKPLKKHSPCRSGIPEKANSTRKLLC